MFDSYSLRARYYPMIILLLPIIILGFFYSLEFESILHFLGSLGVAGALTYLFSQLGRDQGKRKEADLWKSWGGPPTTQLLRIGNLHFDPHTKKRYHQRLHTLCPVPVIPDAMMEASDRAGADHVYASWSKYLISQTRDKKKFPLLFKENTSYGFRRNLWGLRNIALTSTLVIMVLNYFYWSIKIKIFNPLLLPTSFIYSTCSLLIILLFWLVIVKKNWVKDLAFAYAERLCESVDNM